MEASKTAKKPRARDLLMDSLSEGLGMEVISVPTAMRAPTTIMPEIALVTDIRGVCSAGVTLQTT